MLYAYNSTEWVLYLRLPENGGTTLTASEIKLFSQGVNIAPSAASVKTNINGHQPENSADGSTGTYWWGTSGKSWVKFTFNNPVSIDYVEVVAETDPVLCKRAPTNLALWCKSSSTDAKKYTKKAGGNGYTWSAGSSNYLYVPNPFEIKKSSELDYTSPSSLDNSDFSDTNNANIAIFIPNRIGVASVDFYLDPPNPYAPSGTAITVTSPPWSFDVPDEAGMSQLWDLTTLSNGAHSVSAVVHLKDGNTRVSTASFFIDLHGAIVVPNDAVTWPTGTNLGTNVLHSAISDFETWRDRPVTTSTINALWQEILDLAFIHGTQTRGFSRWTGTAYSDLFTDLAWFTGVLNLQVSMAGSAVYNNQAAYNTLLTRLAAGDFDSAWYEVGKTFAMRGRTAANTYIDPAHEFNGNWYVYNPAGVGYPTWIAGWKRMVENFRNGYASVSNAAPPKFVWCYGATVGSYACSDIYDCFPGKAWVDIIGIHNYDSVMWSNVTDFNLLNGTNSMRRGIQLAVAQGIPVYFGEWSVRTAPTSVAGADQRTPAPAQDNVTFMTLMWNTFKYLEGLGLMAGECLFTDFSGGVAQKYIFPVVSGGGGNQNILSATYYKDKYKLNSSSVPTVSVAVKYSLSADRSNPLDLAGATLTGANVYIFVPQVEGLTQVIFYTDDLTPNLPTGTTNTHTENVAPYDYVSTGGDGNASPFSPGSLANGNHNIAVKCTVNGVAYYANASFTVNVPVIITNTLPAQKLCPSNTTRNLLFYDHFDGVIDPADGVRDYDRSKWYSAWTGQGAPSANANTVYNGNHCWGLSNGVPHSYDIWCDRKMKISGVATSDIIQPFIFDPVNKPSIMAIRTLPEPEGTARLNAYRSALAIPTGWGYRYFNGQLTTHDKFHFNKGYIESRIKFPNVPGCWCSVWLMPWRTSSQSYQQNPELDTFEYLGGGALNYRFFANVILDQGSPSTPGGGYYAPGGIIADGNFHTVGFEKANSTWYMTYDGQVFRQGTLGSDMNIDHYILISMQIGGAWWAQDYNNANGTAYAANNPPMGSAAWDWEIDYVAVWQ